VPEEPTTKQLRVCYFGTYRAEYTRNIILINGLRKQGVTVLECHSNLWRNEEDRVNQASGGWFNPKFLWRVVVAYYKLFRKYMRIGDYDIMLVGYPGQFDTYVAKIFTWAAKKPMALDILMSLHLIAEERGLTKKSPFTGQLIFWLEKGGLKLPNLLIAENAEYEEYYCNKYKLPRTRFKRVSHGAIYIHQKIVFGCSTTAHLSRHMDWRLLFKLLNTSNHIQKYILIFMALVKNSQKYSFLLKN